MAERKAFGFDDYAKANNSPVRFLPASLDAREAIQKELDRLWELINVGEGPDKQWAQVQVEKFHQVMLVTSSMVFSEPAGKP